MIARRSRSLNTWLDRALLERVAMYCRARAAPAGVAHAFTILMPIDFSENSTDAVALAARIGGPLHARFVLLHILPQQPAAASDASRPPAIQECKLRALAKISAIAGALRHAVRDAPYEIRLREDSAQADIVREAMAVDADLIVMARHESPVEPLMSLESTPDYIGCHTPCPALPAIPFGDQ